MLARGPCSHDDVVRVHERDVDDYLLARTTPYSIMESAIDVDCSLRSRGCHLKTVRIFVLSTFWVRSRSLRASRTVLSKSAIPFTAIDGSRPVGILNPWAP